MSTFYRQIKSMGTRLEILIPGIEEYEGLALIRALKAEIEVLERQISNYNPDSDLSKINRDAFNNKIKVSGYLKEMISHGIDYHFLTEGFYDFSLGGWTSKPDLIMDTGERFLNLRKTPFNQRILLEDDLLSFLNQDVRIDSGGIGKGMALKIIEKMLRKENFQSAFISFGGSSILAIGKHPYGDSWKLGIQHPNKEGEIIAEIILENNSLSISGNSFNNRKKYGNVGHILDPVKGTFYALDDIISVSSDDPVEAEVLSTALTVAGEENEKVILNNFPGIQYKRIKT
jgi:thiamine biosynthesis lipoprotein